MSQDQNKKLWGGRFRSATDSSVEAFTESVSFDRRLYAHDIRGSIAHAKMLAKVGVLTEQERDDIVRGLTEIRAEIESGDFPWSEALEDVHMNIESRLTDMIGEAGKKLHTGRSRNDQVATDVRLYLRDGIDRASSLLLDAQTALVKLAAQEADTIMPGFTHMQVAQPITFGHHLLAWTEMFERDFQRMRELRARVNVMPLGSAALAGTTFPIDRDFTAAELGFERPSRNSLDAVSDRDFAIEYLAAAALIHMHLSRMSEELVMWSSAQFDFIELGDAYCTGSSIMPQKKNPDIPELLRGKTGRAYGNLFNLLTLMKSQPLAYNRDNQEDKIPLFDGMDTLEASLAIFAALVPEIAPKRDNMRDAALKGFSTATDLADYLVKKGLPFRDAHEVVGKAVAHGVANNIDLADMELAVLQGFSGLVDEDVFDVLTLEGSVAARDHVGGTAPGQVKSAAENARARIEQQRSQL